MSYEDQGASADRPDATAGNVSNSPAAAVVPAAEAVKAPRKAKAPEVPAGYVLCRVLKAGDGKISTGEHVAGHGDLTYSRNDVFAVPRFQAEALELRGFVEFD